MGPSGMKKENIFEGSRKGGVQRVKEDKRGKEIQWDSL